MTIDDLFGVWRDRHGGVHRTNPKPALVELVTELVPLGRRILDIGAADGQLVHDLELAGYNAEGVTMGIENVRYAEEELGVELVIQDMHFMDFEAERFDAVTNIHTLEHAVSPWLAVAEMWRVLKPGGIAVIEVPWPPGSPHGDVDYQHKGYMGQHWPALFRTLGFREQEQHSGKGRFVLKRLPLDGVPHTETRNRLQEVRRLRRGD